MSQNYFANDKILTAGEYVKNAQLIKSGGYTGISTPVQRALARRTMPTEAQLNREIQELSTISGVDTPIDTTCCMTSSFKDNVSTVKNTYKIRTITVGSFKKHILYIDQGTNCCIDTSSSVPQEEVVNNLLIWRNAGDIYNINMKWNVINNNSTDYDVGYQSRTRGIDNIWSAWSTDVKFVAADYPQTGMPNYIKVAMVGVHEDVNNLLGTPVVCLALAYDIRLLVYYKNTSSPIQTLESAAPETIKLTQTDGSTQYNTTWSRDFGIEVSRGLPHWNGTIWTYVSGQAGPQFPGGTLQGYPYTESGRGMLIPGYSTYIAESWYFMFYASGIWNFSTGVGGGWWHVNSTGGGPAQKVPASQHMQGATQTHVAWNSWATGRRSYSLGIRVPSLPALTVNTTVPIPSPLGNLSEGVPGMPTGTTMDDYFNNIEWQGTAEASTKPLTITIISQ